MRIGLDITPLSIPFHCGVRNYAEHLVNNLAKIDKKNQYYLFSLKDVSIPIQSNFHLVKITTILPFSHHTAMPFWIKKYNLDLFHILNSSGSIFIFHKKLVTTVHDVRLSPTYPLLSRFLFRRIYTEIARRVAYKKSIMLIVVSDFIKSELIKSNNIDKIKTVKLGLNTGFRSSSKLCQTTNNYFLAISDFSPRKNIKGVVEAYSLLPSKIKNSHRLVIVVSTFSETIKITRLIELYSVAKYCKIVVSPTNNIISKLFKNAVCFLYPSFYEGFGMPILESMASGCPVITSNFGAMKEIAGDSALLVNPKSPKEIKKMMLLIINNKKLSKRLIKRGIKHVKKFNWYNTAKETLQIYKETIQ